MLLDVYKRQHFGLAARYYCHFTSPIRRYPDLQIHRIIRDNLRGRLTREGKTEHYREILEEVARQSSVCERRAQEAERESDKMKKAEYMSYHLGEEFDGIISGVTGYGPVSYTHLVAASHPGFQADEGRVRRAPDTKVRKSLTGDFHIRSSVRKGDSCPGYLPVVKYQKMCIRDRPRHPALRIILKSSRVLLKNCPREISLHILPG